MDLSKASAVARSVRDSTSATDGMKRIITWCSSQRRHRDWVRLSRIDFESDVSDFPGLFLSNMGRPPPARADGLYLGLFEVPDRCRLMLHAGANPYDPDDDDWAGDLRWKVDAYFMFDALRQMHEIAYESDRSLRNDAEYALGLTYAALLCRALGTRAGARLLGKAKRRTFAVGWDEGDLLVVGELNARGFRTTAGR